MGVESTAILARWMFEPATCPCSLTELIVITAQTGDEYADTGRDVERLILPLMRHHGIRYVQLARHGHLEADGITVLEDSIAPTRVYLRGDYRLSDELRSNGTVPQFGGEHRCSLKFKAFVIETWMTQHLTGPIRHAFGYNAEEPARMLKCVEATTRRVAFGFNRDEEKRITRAADYDTPNRVSFFPLAEWGWNRQDCLDYLQSHFDMVWQKSACVECPFNALRADALTRHRLHPEQVAEAMELELVSLALNPRGTLYPNASLIQITLEHGDRQAARAYRSRLAASSWSLYRVRRIYHPGKTDGIVNPTRKGTADRAVERLSTFPKRAEAERQLDLLARDRDTAIEHGRGLRYVYMERRGKSYPAREEFYTVAPSHVPTKARHGIEWFDRHGTARWAISF
jgi:hypothetical protein